MRTYHTDSPEGGKEDGKQPAGGRGEAGNVFALGQRRKEEKIHTGQEKTGLRNPDGEEKKKKAGWLNGSEEIRREPKEKKSSILHY